MSKYWYVVRDYRGDDDGETHCVDVVSDKLDDVLDACKRDFCESVATNALINLERGARIAAIYDTPMLCGTPWHFFDARENDDAKVRADDYREYDDFPLDHILRVINLLAGRAFAYADMLDKASKRSVSEIEALARDGIRDAVDKLMHETDVATFFYHGSQV